MYGDAVLKKKENPEDVMSLDQKQQELIEKYDDETARFGERSPIASKVIIGMCLILSIFHIYTAGFGVLQEYEHRAFHLSFVLSLIFLVYNIRKKEMSRGKSLFYSTIYAIICGGLTSMMVSAIFKLSIPAEVVLFFVSGAMSFFFKERVWLPSRLIPPADLLVSVICLATTGYLLKMGLPNFQSTLEISGWPLILWASVLFGSTGLIFMMQAFTSLRWCLGKRENYEIHPLKIPYFDLVFAIIAFGLSYYIIVDFDQFVLRTGWANTLDYLVGFSAIVLVLEGCRRSVGVPLTVISLLALLYCFVGPHLANIPGLSYFAHRGYSVLRIIEFMYSGTEGIYGIPLGVCATFVFHFVLFGLIISYTGLGQLFIDMAMAVAGGSPGGPAKVAVIASGFLGSISGSAIANTVTTGSFTIPLMKRVGYRAEFAGAVEASASAGGQIMPPIMGAAAFIMAEFLGIPYIKIACAAILPAFFHFYAVGMMVHFEALKTGMTGLPKEELPVLKDILRERWVTLVPLVVIVYLLISGFTPFLAAFWAIIIACSLGQVSPRMMILLAPVLISLPSILFGFQPFNTSIPLMLFWVGAIAAALLWARSRTSSRDFVIGALPLLLMVGLAIFKVKPFLVGFWTNMLVIGIGVFYKESKMRVPQIVDALEKGTKNALSIGAAVSAVGLIVGTTMLTGLGLKFGHLTISLATATAGFFTSIDFLNLLTLDGATLFFLMIFTALSCFILGMGLPTTAQYIVATIIAAPALMEFGVHPLITHMFVFFYAILADVTPPVALAAYAAAGVSGGDPFKTGNIAFSLSSAKYVVPFIFVYSPIILWMPWLLNPDVPFNFLEFLFVFLSTFLGVTGLSAGMRGYLKDRSTRIEQILCFSAALLFFIRGTVPFITGCVVFIAIYTIQSRRKKKRISEEAVPVPIEI